MTIVPSNLMYMYTTWIGIYFIPQDYFSRSIYIDTFSIQVGVTSFGLDNGCVGIDAPGGYVEVAKYLDWIKEQMVYPPGM